MSVAAPRASIDLISEGSNARLSPYDRQTCTMGVTRSHDLLPSRKDAIAFSRSEELPDAVAKSL
jgi:hypothetical protein